MAGRGLPHRVRQAGHLRPRGYCGQGRLPHRNILRAVEVAQGDVVEAVEAGGVDRARAADRQRAFRVAADRSLHERVADEHRAALPGTLRQHRGEQRPHAAVVVGHAFVRQPLSHQRRLGVGRHVERHVAVLVRQDDGFERCGGEAEEVQTLLREQSRSERQPLRAVVIPRGEDGLDFQSEQQLRENVVQQSNGVRWRHAPVVDVARHDNRVHPPVPGDVDHLPQDERLVLRQVLLMEEASEMPVGGVEKAHGFEAPSIRRREWFLLTSRSLPGLRERTGHQHAGDQERKRIEANHQCESKGRRGAPARRSRKRAAHTVRSFALHGKELQRHGDRGKGDSGLGDGS